MSKPTLIPRLSLILVGLTAVVGCATSDGSGQSSLASTSVTPSGASSRAQIQLRTVSSYGPGSSCVVTPITVDGATAACYVDLSGAKVPETVSNVLARLTVLRVSTVQEPGSWAVQMQLAPTDIPDFVAAQQLILRAEPQFRYMVVLYQGRILTQAVVTSLTRDPSLLLSGLSQLQATATARALSG